MSDATIGDVRTEATLDESAPTDAATILVYNRDPELRIFLDKAFFRAAWTVIQASTSEEVRAAIERQRPGLLLVGIDRPEAMEFLESANEAWPTVPIVAIARAATPELVCDVMKCGVVDFLFGSMNVRNVVPRLDALLAPTDAEVESDVALPAEAATELSSSADYPIITQSERMHRILEIAQTVAPTESTVLIQGESGTGKELIAKRIHVRSKRERRPFVEVNCGALPENLLESQLFGHEKGSFTGASQRQIGLFEVADKGTIFLDEIGEMSLDMQVKLLRVLQFKEFRRVGGSDVVKVDVRVIAATNKDLSEAVSDGSFRADLFYRLNVICLQVPPLRERLEDVSALVEHFRERLSRDRDYVPKRFPNEAIAQLRKYRWTGNIRELENAVERLILLAKGDVVEVSDVAEHLGKISGNSLESPFATHLTLNEVKRIHIENTLRANGGNKMKTARILQINVKTLYNLIKSLDIETP